MNEIASSKIAIPQARRLASKRLFVSDHVSCASSHVYLKRYEEFIERQGCRRTAQIQEADIILVDTCAVNLQKEDESLALIKHNQAVAKDGTKVIVCGCLAGINPGRLREHFQGDFFSPKTEAQLAQILGVDEEEAQFLSPFEVRGRFMGGDETWAGLSRPWFARQVVRFCGLLHRIDNRVSLRFVPRLGKFLDWTQAINPKSYAMTISQGCLGNCSFCVIPLAKGRTQSMPLAAIVEKIRSLVQSGVKRLILTSEDTGAYGKDIGTTFVDLLRHIHNIDGDFTLHIVFFDPRWLRLYGDALLPILKQGKVRYLQLPLQSGNNRVLNRMKRVYQVEHVLPVIREYKKRLPHLAMTTQLIVGFPGETREQFADTRALLRENLFDHADVFPYSPRPGADSTRLPDQIPEEEILRRLRIEKRDWMLSRFLPKKALQLTTHL